RATCGVRIGNGKVGRALRSLGVVRFLCRLECALRSVRVSVCVCGVCVLHFERLLRRRSVVN
uniref:Uncharacterized protein n=1 Tax=Anopheles dirus TaxID=7168 RepID=A0A182NYS6_9DIPT